MPTTQDTMSNNADQEIRPRGNGDPAPLSFAQELLWLLDRASPGVSAWNVPRAFMLRGELDMPALLRTLDAIVARHEALRTVFATTDDGARQIVLPAAPVACPVVDLSSLPAADRQAECDRLVREQALAPFDLTRDVLLRAMVIRLDGATHVLCLNSHHIVSDGWSKGILFRELTAFYNGFHSGVAVELAPLPIQFADYATWERDALHDEALAEDAAYWREELAGAPTALALPTDFARTESPRFEAGRCVTVLPHALVARLQEVARANGATRYMALLAGYAALLARYSGQDDVVIGSPIAGRSQSETEDLIGYFANTLVLRTRLGGDPTFAELLNRVRDTALGAYDHQAIPFEKLALELRQGRQLTHAPLIQAVLTMEDTLPAELRFDGLAIEPIPLADGATKFDLTMLVAEQADGLRLSLWYRASLFAPETVERMLAHFRALLESAASDPSQRVSVLAIMTDAERRALESEWNVAEPTMRDLPITTQIERIAVARPDTLAVRCGDVAITYRDLDACANRIARHLQSLGARTGSVVAISLDRSVEMVIALLGVLKTGAAYVPIVPDSPRSRVAQQVTQSGAQFVITMEAHRATVASEITTTVCLDTDATAIDREPATPPAVSIALDDPAYVLFTSGSTGVPKGVVVTHGNLAHYVAAISARLGVPEAVPGWHFGLGASWGADLGHTALFPALTSGGTLHVLAAGVSSEPAAFVRAGAAQPLDVLKLTPSHWGALTAGLTAAELATVLPRQWLVLGGEALRWTQAAPWARALAHIGSRLLNHYGPTEATVGATTWEVLPESSERPERAERSAATVPIGRPLPGVRVAVLDAAQQLVPIGVAGELYLGGPQLARGYVGAPAQTAERFVALAIGPNGATAGGTPARAYRTGDRVRWRADGTLEFLGRVDDQVKLRGYRVELGEIEATLAQHPAVAQGAVLALASEPGADAGVEASPELALHACLVPREGTAAATLPATLSAWLATRLPDYMLPGAITVLDALPLTANGKLDRRALERRVYEERERATVDDRAGNATAASAREARTDTERAVIGIWEDALKRSPIGVRDNFFALGGHSLVAIRVLGRISKQFGVRLPLRTLFESPTPEAVAAVIDGEIAEVQRRELDAMLTSLAGMSDADVARSMSRLPGSDAK